MIGTLPATILVAQEESGALIGFLEVGLRSHADGCNPAHAIGFIEGWFVQETFRGRGAGKALILNPAVAGAGKRRPPLTVTICGKSDYHLDGDLRSSWKLLAANAKTEPGTAELPDLG
jgi:hypothetical protein